MEELVKWLVERQGQLGETDAAFARRLGIFPEHWGMLQRGKRSVTIFVLRRALAAFPEDAATICHLAGLWPDGVEVA